ncbi:MAG: FtsX-like permease family protein [Actinomycetota bacterium]|nr:FtsX-like permease family protein [Actinomycetota bacterium]
MFKSYIYKIALRYFFSKDSKTIVNRINGFSFIMIVAAACVLLVVLSAFEGLKDFGLFYTSSFDPDYKVVPKKGKYLFVDKEALNKIRGLDGVLGASEVLEEKVIFSNEINSGATMLKGVFFNYHLASTLDSLSLVGVFSPMQKNTIYIGADLASSLEVVLSEDFSLLATAPKSDTNSLFDFSPFSSMQFDIEGIYQISSDIERKYAFTSMASMASLIGAQENAFTAIEIFSNKSLNDKDIKTFVVNEFGENAEVLTKQDLNPALYKMLNTENFAVYLIFSLVALVAMFNLVGSLTIMIVEKKRDLRILKSLGGEKNDINQVFFLLGMVTSFFGGVLGVVLAWVIIVTQNSFSLILVPGTSIPYPISFTFSNVFIVLTTILTLGVITSLWSTVGLKED